MFYQRHPYIVQAFKLPEDLKTIEGRDDLPDWFVDAVTKFPYRGERVSLLFSPAPDCVMIAVSVWSRRGVENVAAGDYLLRNEHGELSGCQACNFALQFDPVMQIQD